ncbi:MAG TPA: GTP-binding protein, partial [Myxococcota bacterium]|nr:GTP-binding protein [Myxococcota bacterium]
MSGAQPLDRRTEAARDPARDPGPAPPGAPPLVLGTAGHIDHGKTALVRALTGQDLDRLPEEKARGITIELGFAPLALADDLAVAIVDVPGHERF